MATYTLHINIDPMILKNQSSDNLCIAKKVNDGFTTIFQGASIRPVGKQNKLFAQNTFQWTEEYRVFLATKFKSGMQVSSATSSMGLTFGQRVSFESDAGDLQEAEDADTAAFDDGSANKTNSFILAHVPQQLQASVECKTGDEEWATIYVDNRPHNGEQTKILTPINKYSLFWDSNLVTGAMIDYSKSSSPQEFSFPAHIFEMTWRFGYKNANVPSSSDEQPKWYKGTSE